MNKEKHDFWSQEKIDEIECKRQNSHKMPVGFSGPSLFLNGKMYSDWDIKQVERQNSERAAEIKIPNVDLSSLLIFHEQQLCDQKC